MTGWNGEPATEVLAGARCGFVDNRGAPIEQGKPLDLAACLAICAHTECFLQSPVRSLSRQRSRARRVFVFRPRLRFGLTGPIFERAHPLNEVDQWLRLRLGKLNEQPARADIAPTHRGMISDKVECDQTCEMAARLN